MKTREWTAGLLAGAMTALALCGSALAQTETPLTLTTPTGALFGTLMLPTNAPAPVRVPVVLLIAGSGPTDRDGNSSLLNGPNNSLKMLAQALAEAGYASLRYDKRGIAASKAAGAHEADLRFDHYVNDAVAWLDLLQHDSRFSSTAVIGHSEGSLIGMIAARLAHTDAYVSLAGIGRPAGQVLRTQMMPRMSAELAAQNEAILSSLEHGQLVEQLPPGLALFYHPSLQPYLISWFKYVPTEEIAKLTIPVLIIQGDTDIQVQVSEAQLLQQAKPDARLVIVPGMNHVLKSVGAADRATQLKSYSDPSLPISAGLTRAIIDFLRQSSAGSRTDTKP